MAVGPATTSRPAAYAAELDEATTVVEPLTVSRMIVPTVACTTLVAWQAVAAQPSAVAGAAETSVPSRLNTAKPESLANELSGRTRRADMVFTPGCGFSPAFCGLVKQGPCLVR